MKRIVEDDDNMDRVRQLGPREDKEKSEAFCFAL